MTKIPDALSSPIHQFWCVECEAQVYSFTHPKGVPLICSVCLMFPGWFQYDEPRRRIGASMSVQWHQKYADLEDSMSQEIETQNYRRDVHRRKQATGNPSGGGNKRS